MVTVPAWALFKLAMMRPILVLPLPLSPTMPVTVPRASRMFMSRNPNVGALALKLHANPRGENCFETPFTARSKFPPLSEAMCSSALLSPAVAGMRSLGTAASSFRPSPVRTLHSCPRKFEVEPRPPDGNQPVTTAPIRISIMLSQKDGTLSADTLAFSTVRSKTVPLRRPAIRPSAVPRVQRSASRPSRAPASRAICSSPAQRPADDRCRKCRSCRERHCR